MKKEKDDIFLRLRTIYAAALDICPEARNDYIAQACDGNDYLYNQLALLIKAEEDATGFFEQHPWEAFLSSDPADHLNLLDEEVDIDLPFKRLGEYRLIRRLGEGGMGIVFLAVQESLKRQVALKIIRPDRLGSLEVTARFLREIKTIAGLQHSNIIKVFNSGEEQGVRFFVMEVVPGQGLDCVLRQAVRRSKRIPLDDALRWGRDIASALHCAHQAGVIHRDVKPSNIRITSEGKAMLMDFGLSRNINLSTLTITGEFRGTPCYASPEQVESNSPIVDERIDIYGLGVTLYEVLTGHVPFNGETVHQVFRQILETEPVSPRLLNPKVPRDVEIVTLKAMEKDAMLRYPTMLAFHQDLFRLSKGVPILAKSPSTLYKLTKLLQRNRTFVLGVLLTLIALFVGTAIASWQAYKAKKVVERWTKELSLSQIEKARLLFNAGLVNKAESMLWKEYIESMPGTDSIINEKGKEEVNRRSHWALWSLYAKNPCLHSFTTGNSPLQSISLSPDGELLATGSQDGCVQIWDMPEGLLRVTLPVNQELTNWCTFSPDGSLLGMAGRNNDIIIYEVETLSCMNVKNNDSNHQSQIHWHPQQPLYATFSSLDNKLWIFNSDTFELTHCVDSPKDRFKSIAFSSSGRLIGTSDNKNIVSLYDIATFNEVCSYRIDYNLTRAHASKIVFDRVDPKDKRLFVTNWNEIEVLEIDSTGIRLLNRFNIPGLHFSEMIDFFDTDDEGRFLLIGLASGKVIVLDSQKGDCLMACKGYTNSVRGVCFDTNRGLIHTASRDGDIRTWESDLFKAATKLVGHEDTVFDVEFSSDGEMLASASIDGTIRLWDVNTGKQIGLKRSEEMDGFSCILFHPKNNSLLVSGDWHSGRVNCAICLWELDSSEIDDKPKIIGQQGAWITSIACCSDGRFIASTSGDETAIFWDGYTDKKIAELDCGDCEFLNNRIDCVDFGPVTEGSPYPFVMSICDGKIVSGTITEKGVTNLTRSFYSTHGRVRILKYCPEWKYLAMGTDQGDILLYDKELTTCQAVLSGNKSWVMDLDFSPDGKMLVSAGFDRSIRLWDVEGMSCLATLNVHKAAVFSVAFHPTKPILVSGGSEKALYLWDLTYYSKHIHGNMEYWRRKLNKEKIF